MLISEYKLIIQKKKKQKQAQTKYTFAVHTQFTLSRLSCYVTAHHAEITPEKFTGVPGESRWGGRRHATAGPTEHPPAERTPRARHTPGPSWLSPVRPKRGRGGRATLQALRSAAMCLSLRHYYFHHGKHRLPGKTPCSPRCRGCC